MGGNQTGLGTQQRGLRRVHECKAGQAGRRRTVVVGSPYLVPVWYRPGRKMSLSAACEGLEGGNIYVSNVNY